jgi:hypothetical protein
VPRRNRWWLWGSRVVFVVILAGLVRYLAKVGLEDADKLGSSIGAVVALAALGAPYLLPSPGAGVRAPESDRAEDTGTATATAGGYANTGVDIVEGDERSAHVLNSGDAKADGTGSVANTGVQRRPRL